VKIIGLENEIGRIGKIKDKLQERIDEKINENQSLTMKLDNAKEQCKKAELSEK
jgi:regulator of replication initiation timing